MKPLNILILDEEQYLVIGRKPIMYVWLVIVIDMKSRTFRTVKNRYTGECPVGTLQELNEFDFTRLFQ